MLYRYHSKCLNGGSKILRIKVPSKIHHEIKNDFVRIRINKNIEFLYKISEEKRFVVPKALTNKINFLGNNLIEITNIKLLKQQKDETIVKNGKINLIQIIPKKMRSGSPISILIKGDELICFCKSFRGALRKIEIKKGVPLEFCRFLGYYQAEGGKEKKINKENGRQVVFTNTNANIIRDFIILSKKVIKEELWNIEIKLKKRNRKKEENLKNMLEELGINKKDIKIKIERNLRDFSIRLYICSTILSDIIIGLMETIKDYLIDESTLLTNKSNLKMYVSFIQGLFAGDGNYNAYQNKLGGVHHRLIFYEEDYNYALQYKKLLEKAGIGSKIIKIKNKNLFIVRATLNWELLLLIKELELFDYHKSHGASLKKFIKIHKSYRSHKHLVYLGDNIDIERIQELIKKERVICYNWIKKMVDRGVMIKKDRGLWKLSEKGERIKKVLSKIV